MYLEIKYHNTETKKWKMAFISLTKGEIENDMRALLQEFSNHHLVVDSVSFTTKPLGNW